MGKKPKSEPDKTAEEVREIIAKGKGRSENWLVQQLANFAEKKKAEGQIRGFRIREIVEKDKGE